MSPAPRRWSLPALGLLAAILYSATFFPAFFTPAVGLAREKQAKADVPQAAKPAAAAPVAAPVQAQDLAGGIVLPDNNDLRRKLDAIRKQVDEKNYADVTRFMGTLLEDVTLKDFFLNRDPNRPTGLSFRAELWRMIGELPVEGKESYELQFGVPARQSLTTALAASSEGALQEVVVRYFHTKAGYEALYRLGAYHWDHGHPREAAICWERLQSVPGAAAPFEPGVSLTIATCWECAGDHEQARAALLKLKQKYPEATFQIAGAKQTLPMLDDEQTLAWLVAMLGKRSLQSGELPQELVMHRGDPARNAVTTAGPPFLSPRWRREISSDAAVQTAIDNAQQTQLRKKIPLIPTLYPLITGGIVFQRTGRGVHAFNLESGLPLWNYPSDDDSSSSGIDRKIWKDTAFGSLSSDGECLFLAEEDPQSTSGLGDSGLNAVAGNQGMGVAMRRGRVFAPNPGDNTTTRPATNSLAAIDIRPPREGNLRWQINGQDGSGESQLAETFFLGSPLPLGGRLYVLAETKGTIRLVVLDAATGRLQWSQELAVAEKPILQDPFRRMAGTMPSISENIVVCPISGGGVVAVEMATQSLQWAYQYPRTPQSRLDPQHGLIPKLEQEGRWIDPSVTIAEGKVVLTPLESVNLHCLDLKDGRPLWTQPRGEGLYVACIHQGKIILVGQQQVTALNLNDGQPAWEKPLTLPQDSFASGRGVYSGQEYFLPLTDASVIQIDLKLGSIKTQSRSSREVIPGNLVWNQGSLVSQGAAYLEVFDELQTLEGQLQARLRDNPQDPDALLRQAEIDLHAGRIDAGIERFRTAHQTTPNSHSRNRLIAALLDGIRLNSANRDQFQEELDRLGGN